MKKTALILSILLLLATVFTACNSGQTTDQSVTVATCMSPMPI